MPSFLNTLCNPLCSVVMDFQSFLFHLESLRLLNNERFKCFGSFHGSLFEFVRQIYAAHTHTVYFSIVLGSDE